MKLINNRYKILQFLEKDNNYKKFIAVDLLKRDEKVFLYIMKNNNFTKPFINYCTDNFYETSSLIHPNLISVKSYGTIETIDDKDIKEARYYYTTEYFDGQPLDSLEETLHKTELFELYNQLSHALQFLHFHGIIYKYLGLNTIFFQKNEEGFKIRLLDLITLKKDEIQRKHEEFPIAYYIAPEINYNIQLGFYTDIYSLGAVLYYGYTLESFKHFKRSTKPSNDIVDLDNKCEGDFLELIKKMTSIDFMDRFTNIYQVNRFIKNIYNLDEKLEDKFFLEKLNFKTPLMGRDLERKEILSIVENNNKGINQIQKGLILIEGDKGIGKTRLINEITYRLQLKGIKMVNTSIMAKNDNFYSLAPKLLKQILKFAPAISIEKYSKDLIKLVPEIGIDKNINPSKELSETKELLKLYDRVTNFILDATVNSPIIITIDDADIGDISIAEFIDYFVTINRFKKAPVIIIISYSTNRIQDEKLSYYLEKWQSSGDAIDIQLARLTVEEVARMIKHILGYRKDWLDLAIHIMRDTDGNPKAIENVLKDMYTQDVLTMQYEERAEEFIWQFDEDGYSKLKKVYDIDESLVKQLSLTTEEEKKLLKIISVFKTSVSSQIINYMMKDNNNNYIDFENLTKLKILNESLEDWGYTYGFYNKQLKEYIYTDIQKREKMNLHILASNILEELYKKEGRENKEELIYHLLQSNQEDKAIHYCIEAANSMLKLKIYSQALTFYKRAYKLLIDINDNRKLETLMNLAYVYQKQGKTPKAINRLKEAIELAVLQKDDKLIIDAKNRLSYIYLMRNDVNTSIYYLEEVIALSDKINYIDGLLEGAYLLSKVYINTRKIQDAKDICNQYIKKAYIFERNNYIGLFLKQEGMLQHLDENPIEAIKYFKDSIDFLEKSKERQEIAATLNNIGSVFLEFFQDSINARQYCERALNIAKQYNIVENIARAYNYLADSYMLEGEYKKAIVFLNKNIDLSLDFQDEIIRFLSYVNLIKCYTYEGEYKNAYNYLLKAKRELDISFHQSLYMELYFKAAAIFYMTIGQYNKAIYNINQFFECFPQADLRKELKMKALNFFAKSYIEKNLEDKELLDIINQYRKTFFNKDKRELLQAAILYFYEKNNIEMAKELYHQDQEMSSLFDHHYFRIKGKYIGAMLSKNKKEKYAVLQELVNSTSSMELEYEFYKDLGDVSFEMQQYYEATNYYLKALYLLKCLYFKVPEEFKFNYLIDSNKYIIKHKLMNMEMFIKSGMMAESFSKDSIELNYLEDPVDIQDFFNISNLQSLFKNQIFYDLAMNKYKKIFLLEINTIEGLLDEFTLDTTHNLDLLLRLVAKYVLASKAAIFIENTSYKKISAVGQEIFTEEVKHIFEKVYKSGEGLLINNIKNFMDIEKDFIGNTTKAVICLPIYQKNKEEKFQNNLRRWGNKKIEKILGYLYLETEEMFNNFTEEGLKKCQELIPLASLLLYNDNLKQTAFVDKLTKVYTRKYFEDILYETIGKAKEDKEVLSIIMCDIDNFKLINDTYGHQMGDQLLERVGEILKESVRETDWIGRYGGEEFIILLPNTPKNSAYEVAEKIRRGVRNAKVLNNDEDLTISCGVATFPDDGSNKNLIIQRADQALYVAKEKGRNCSIAWQEGIEFTDKRLDKLAGIITGNVVEDQNNVLFMAQIMELISENISLREKVYTLTGYLIEAVKAQEVALFIVEEDRIIDKYSRRRFEDEFVKDVYYNEELIEKTIVSKRGDYFIDWDDISQIDVFTGTPNWKSVIVVPIILNEVIKGIIYLSVPSKEKEFEFGCYNIVKIVSGLIGAILNTSPKE